MPTQHRSSTSKRQRAFVDITELTHRLGISEAFVRRLVRERRVPYYKVGWLIRFDPDEIEEWIGTAAR